MHGQLDELPSPQRGRIPAGIDAGIPLSQLRDEPRLKPGGMYEMATLELREGSGVKPATVRRLAKEATALNRKLGDPTLAAKRASKQATKNR